MKFDYYAIVSNEGQLIRIGSSFYYMERYHKTLYPECKLLKVVIVEEKDLKVLDTTNNDGTMYLQP